jgi:hypothetical protein
MSNNPHIAFGDPAAETVTQVGLFAGDRPVATKTVTISSGADVAKYAVLGKVDASGEYKLCDLAAVDGSAVPRAIACYDVDSSGADVVAAVYTAGFFNHAALVWHASFDTLAEKLAAFDVGNHSISVGEVAYSVG